MPPTADETPPAPKLVRPQFDVWMTPEGADPNETEPEYVARVTITNQDQLTAENQARSAGVMDARDKPFHMSNLWIWAAMIRLGLTADKFKVFTQRMDYRPVKREDDDGEPDPTFGAPAPSTDSGSPWPPNSGEDPPTG